MKRNIDKSLKDWADNEKRKPLIIRGARQVGKTYAVRELGKKFDSFVEINFEEQLETYGFFETSLSPDFIVEQLSLYTGSEIIPGKTLLFIDEIQACPNAIRSLRFFYEKMPELHVVAAGSLLEFALSEIPSFGVGRISSLFMYPVTFFEFLSATGNDLLKNAIEKANWENPLSEPIHKKAMLLLKTYMVLGGMPEAVNSYVERGNLIESQKILDELITTMKDDFSKYKTRISLEKIDAVFTSVSLQAGGKFSHNAVGNGSSSSFSTALNLLQKAGLCIKVFHSSSRGVPLSAQIKSNRFKVLPFDSGIYQRLMKLDLQSYVTSKETQLTNKGALAEIYTGLSLCSAFPNYVKPDLFYWHREKRGSNAEIDYVIEHRGNVVPVEVKSSGRGKMQSMHIFLEERNLPFGLRIAGEQFSVYNKIKVIPLYAAENILNLL